MLHSTAPRFVYSIFTCQTEEKISTLWLMVVGIKPGDSSSVNADESLASLKEELRSQNRVLLRDVAVTDDRKEAVAGFNFSCHRRRGESFIGQPNVDGFPFCENFLDVYYFPGIPDNNYLSRSLERKSVLKSRERRRVIGKEEIYIVCLRRCLLFGITICEMEETKESKLAKEPASFASINEDLIQDILKRLPALSFASAACVSKAWNLICSRILSKPKFVSAVSLNQSSQDALEEVIDKVLSEPIRPHFAVAIAFGSRNQWRNSFSFVRIRLAERLGWMTPIAVASAAGIMGRDVVANEFKEVMGKFTFSDFDGDEVMYADYGICLTVGFVPGLKVDVVAMSRAEKASMATTVDNFIMDIRAFSASTSGCTSPPAIMLFVDQNIDPRPIIEKLDYAMSKDTIISGNGGALFLQRSCRESINVSEHEKYPLGAVALVFARDRNKPHDIGEIQFHAAVSNGVSAIGPKYKAVSARENCPGRRTWLTAKIEGEQEILGGNRILDDIEDELENRVASSDLYIGVTKRRNRSIGSEKPRLMTFLAFHGIVGADEDFLFADGGDIKTGDSFQIYQADPSTALSSSSDVSVKLRHLKLELCSENSHRQSGAAHIVGNREFIGGFIFSCSGRGETFFGRSNTDSCPILENFPEVPLAGVFCDGEIGRGLKAQEGQEQGTVLLHIYSTVYLLVSYIPKH